MHAALQTELGERKAGVQPPSRAVWCFGINYEDPKYFYIQGMAGAHIPCPVKPSGIRYITCRKPATHDV